MSHSADAPISARMNCVSVAPTSPSHRRSVELISPTSIVICSTVTSAVNVLQPLSPRIRPLRNEIVGGLPLNVGTPAISTTRQLVPFKFGGWVAASPDEHPATASAASSAARPANRAWFFMRPSTPRC